jgi:MFS family permease
VSWLPESPRLRRILAAYTVNRLGTWFGFVALSVTVFDHTHSAVAVAALLVAGQVLPAFVVPAVVARVESSRRSGELSGLYLLEALVTAGLALLLLHFWLPAVLVLVALDGTAALTASALLRAAAARTAHDHDQLGAAHIPDHEAQEADQSSSASHEAERNANAALNVAFSGTFVLGPVLAGLVVAAAGSPVALLIDAATFAICGAMLLDLRPHVEEPGGSVRARLRTAWQHINDVPALRALLLAEALALVFFEFSGPIEVAYAKATLHAGARGYGLLMTAWGAGVVVGSLVFARSSRRPARAMLSAGTLGVGLAYLGFAAAPSLLIACLAALVGGVGNGVQWASLIGAVQRLTPQRLQGRLMGAVESLGALCPALGLSLGGALVALSSPRGAFLVAGLGATATTAMFLRLSLSDFDPAVDDEAQAPAADRAPGLHESLPRGPGELGEAEPTRDRPAEVRPAS